MRAGTNTDYDAQIAEAKAAGEETAKVKLRERSKKLNESQSKKMAVKRSSLRESYAVCARVCVCAHVHARLPPDVWIHACLWVRVWVWMCVWGGGGGMWGCGGRGEGGWVCQSKFTRLGFPSELPPPVLASDIHVDPRWSGQVGYIQ